MNLPRGARAILIPYTEEAIDLGIAGETMIAAPVSAMMVQLYSEDGSPFRTPITRDGAGWDNQPCYLIVHGDVETGPGHFEKGIIRSSPCASVLEAMDEWNESVEAGLYDPDFDHPEIRYMAPTLDEVF